MKNLTMTLALVAAAAACGKKKEGAAAPDAASGKPGVGAVTPAPPPPAPAPTEGGGTAGTASGGAVADLPLVNDCPKSLAGSETVARVIKKECGTIQVTAEYYIDGSLTIEGGVVLKVAEGAEIAVGYHSPTKLIVKGTAAEPVVMTAAGDQVPGFWKGLRLYQNANRSQISGLVVEHAGDDRGAVSIQSNDVVFKDSTIRNAKEIGLRIENDVKLAELSGNKFEKAGKMAMSVQVSALGGIGGGNKFEEGSQIEVRGGTQVESAKWQNAGAPYYFTEDTGIDGKNARTTVEIAPGTELRFADNVELSVGYHAAASLVVAAPADKPVVFTSGGDKSAGVWKGIRVYTNGDAKLEGVVIEAGGKDEKGALWVQSGGSLSLKGSTLRTNLVGLSLEADAKVGAIDGNTFSGNTKLAVQTPANQVAKLGPANKMEKEKVEIQGGVVKETGTWSALGAAVEVSDDVGVGGRAVLTLAPGLDLAFRSGAELSVGYNEIAGLKAQGTADKPIRLHGLTDDPGSWDGLILYGEARDVVIDNVVIEGSGGNAGVSAKLGATAKISNLTCRKCAEAAVTYDCKTKVEITAVKAEDGTPAGEKKPEGCE